MIKLMSYYYLKSFLSEYFNLSQRNYLVIIPFYEIYVMNQELIYYLNQFLKRVNQNCYILMNLIRKMYLKDQQIYRYIKRLFVYPYYRL
jgi:hypothetical protein